MKAGEFAPVGPLHEEPSGPFVVESERRLALHDALRGVELGVYDERIVVWLARWDTGTARTVVSWLERVREAGYDTGVRRALAAVERELDRAERGEPGE